MAELARGSVVDRPWGRTFATLGLRGVTGQLTLAADGKHFFVAFERGAVVAAASPLASDAAVRVALTGHLVSSSQVPEISRRLADAPERDEVDVIAELARLGPDHALRLRRRVIAQRAARTFSINHGEFSVTDYIELPITPGCELDVRAVVYMGARTNLSEQRLSAELGQLGSWFQLRPDLDEDLPQFGFSDVEQPVIERLRDGGTIEDLEAFATTFVDARTVRAVVYALASYHAFEAIAAPPSRVLRPTPEGSRPLRPTPVPGAGHPAPPPSQASPAVPPTPARTTSPSGRTLPSAASPTPARTTSPSGRTPLAPALARTASPSGRTSPAPTPTVSRGATPPGGGTPRTATSTGPLPSLSTPAGDSLDDSVDPPTQRDGVAAGLPPPDRRRNESDPALRPPTEAPRHGDPEPVAPSTRDRRSSPGLPRPLEDALRSASEPVARPRRDSSSSPALRRPSDDALRGSSSPGLRLPPDDAGPDLVIRRVAAARPPPARQVARTDSPQSHDVKGLIAQRMKLLDQGADHFQLLGVSQDVAPEALRRAYFVLARQLHPDRLAALGISDDGKHAQRLFAQINAGFAILSDPSRRAQYVDVLRRGGEAAVRAEQARAEDLALRILDAEEAFRRGELALRRDQPSAAIAELELAIQLNPAEADYHALLAWAQFCAAPDKMAIAPRTRTMLDKAIQRSPRAVTARFYLGRVERMLGCDKDALRHFREVLAAAPGHAEAASEVRVIEARLLGGDKSGGGVFGRNKR